MSCHDAQIAQNKGGAMDQLARRFQLVTDRQGQGEIRGMQAVIDRQVQRQCFLPAADDNKLRGPRGGAFLPA